MLRQDHKIMITQNKSWTTLKLKDKEEFKGVVSVVRGTWSHTSESYNDQEIKFTSDNPQYYYWEWVGAHVGVLSIGSKMGRASHREDEKEIFQVLIALYGVIRAESGKFEVIAGSNGEGIGNLTYNVNPHFEKGNIFWTPTRY